MSEHSSARGACVDDLELGRLLDGELDGSRLELAHVHLASCAHCSGRLRALREESLLVHELLGREDEAAAEAAAAALGRAESASRHLGRAGQVRRRSPAGRIALGIAAAAAAVILVVFWAGADADLTAAPVRILDEAVIRERAWMYRPGKVLRWNVESEISGSSRLADGHYQTKHWLSTVEGAEGAILRKTDAMGRLVYATWRRSDGSVVSYSSSRASPLRIEPATADIESQMGSLSSEARRVLQVFLDRRTQDSEVAIQGSRFANWFLDAVNSRRGARAERIRSPDGREAYYLRVERGPGASLDRGVTKMVIETYIEAEGFRRYRLRTQRELAGGGTWIEDARWTGFEESDMADFEANTLDDLLRSLQPVKVTVGELARGSEETSRKAVEAR